MNHPPASAAEANASRLACLDAARAVAALAVLAEHMLDRLSPAFAHFSHHTFNLGVFGVLLFFLVSGYVIPISLERSGSLKSFWAGRLCRLYPLYFTSLAGALLLWLVGAMPLPADFLADLPRSLLVNLTMVQEIVRVPHALGLYWTLGYEMLFYALFSILFLCRLNRRTLTLCWLGVAALFIADVAAPLLYGRPLFKIAAFWVLTFFIGNLYYRFSRGEVARQRLVGLLWALAAVVGGGAWLNFVRLNMPVDPGPTVIAPPAYLSAWAAAYLCFPALLATAPHRFPQWLRFLGQISYSIYLLQAFFLGLGNAPWGWGDALVRPALCIACAFLTYQTIERPGIALGKWLVRPARDAAPPGAGNSPPDRRRAAA